MYSPHFSGQVDSAWASGDKMKARLCSKRALRFSLTGICIGVVALVGLIVYVVVIVA